VDANPRQNALLELKLAGIRRLDHADFFQLFGVGHHAHFRALYHDALRPGLTPFAQQWWDARGAWFSGRGLRDSLYFRGLSGLVARLVRGWMDVNPGLRAAIDRLLTATTLDDQRAIYDQEVAPRMWNGAVRWAISRQTTMSLLGVPCSQTREVARANQRGVAGFILDAIAYVFRNLPVWTNYFWRVYLRGSYTRDCCPEYLKPANFAALKGGLGERIVPVTSTITDFLRGHPGRLSRFVLLDHMDWMSDHRPHDLAAEWEQILTHATPNARAIFRSAHADPTYLDRVNVGGPGQGRGLNELLHYHRDLAAELHRQDRVGTYGGFHIADIRP